MMVSRYFFCPLVLCLVVISSACAQPAQKPFEPEVGQQGKDVIWVPTPQALVDKMLDIAKLTPNDVLMDLGSGDGRTVITGAKRGARSMGIEYNPEMVEYAKRNAEKSGVSGKATFVKADLFETDLSQATVITMFLLPSINMRLRPKILDLKPGTRIVSNTFTMGDWDADETANIGDEAAGSWRTALLWIVPAKVEGVWQSPQGELVLKQSFQMLTGMVKGGANSGPIASARMTGDQISFVAGGATYTGRVSGNEIKGTVRAGSTTTPWSATRASR